MSLDRNFFAFIKEIENRLLPITEISGTDTDDRIYSDLKAMWKHELSSKRGEKEIGWYSKAYDYWENDQNCPISDDGVLGGFGFLTDVDVRDSNNFLDSILAVRPNLQLSRVADCGAGIGRVSKHFLLPRCAHVDLIEQSPRLLASSREYIGPESSRTSAICQNMRDFIPAPNTYDMIWIQWVVGHLHDKDFVDFFRNCARGLTQNGVIILKDNCAEDWTFVVDKNDSSIARAPPYMKVLFDMADCKILLAAQQTDFPPELSTKISGGDLSSTILRIYQTLAVEFQVARA